MALSDRKLKRMYNRLNRNLFNGELPDNTEVWWESVSGCVGLCSLEGSGTTFDESSDTYFIRINPAIAWSTNQTEFTLIHEMAHIVAGHKALHGPKFQLIMLTLAEEGAFKTLW